MNPYKPYIPQNVGDMMDLLGSMFLSSPTFKDKTGYFPERNIDTEFHALDQGLQSIRKRIGEENYLKLAALSAKMRTHFEADPEDKADGSVMGRNCIIEMETILKAGTQRKPR